MAINRGPFNALIDDDGSGTTGSIWNKAAIQTVLLDPIDGLVAPQLVVGNSSTTIVPLIVNGSEPAGGVVAAFYSRVSGRETAIQFSDGFIYNLGIGSDMNGSFAVWAGRYPGNYGTRIFSVAPNGVVYVANTLVFEAGGMIARNSNDSVLVLTSAATFNAAVGAGVSLSSVTAGGHIDCFTGQTGSAQFRVFNGIGQSALNVDINATHVNSYGANFGLYINSNSATPSGVRIQYPNASPNGTGNEFVYANDSTTARFVVRSNGGILNYQANDVNLSDAQVKHIEGPAEAERARFAQLQFVRARYTDAPQVPADVMLTAQDVERVYPELVGDFTPGLLGVREHGLVMRGLKVVQEHDALIDALLARLDALEQEVASCR